MMSKYLITLTPTGKFFFGGDMMFETGSEYDKTYSSYIIHSSTMPQQTSLLGMLRFLILSNDNEVFDRNANHIRKGQKAAADALIGPCSFQVDAVNHQFGKIEKIGPCFIYDKADNKAYFRYGKDESLAIDDEPKTEAVFNGHEMQIPDLRLKSDNTKRYTGKETLDAVYIAQDGIDTKQEFGKDGLFIEDSRIGIDKDYEGKTKKSAFYKQVSYRLKEGFCFAFVAYLDIKPEDAEKYNKQMVNIGGDSSCFVLNVTPLDETLKEENVYYPKGKPEKVMLLSDAYIPVMPEGVSFAITSVRPFRFLHTENLEDASKYNVKYRQFRSPKRYDLYQAGSVFYVDDKKEFEAALEVKSEFRQIGYNYYI